MERVEDFFCDVQLVEITNKDDAIKQLNSKTSCCWGSGEPIGNTGFVTLASPSASSPTKKRLQFYCKASLIGEHARE